ncbi:MULTISPECIES: dienelactone hydrolase family protein [unclassified Streptomyces]|uniref:dienelactone hydrolase family protein n=1 Tax=unclassified Streptomyces TaxID=2593676 RepID=UPI000A62E26C|nr:MULTISPECIES: dienelactone hydrolase family protein [unclassified Streptomyces]AZM58676.1 hydrolase [Streptomyces sp. WAC 01438]RSM88369.1 hydrolase [Streptomyces sp. WAC 01420]
MVSETVTVPSGGAALTGDLELPAGVGGVVLFAHGSGSSRHSPRNQAVAAALQLAGFGTLLMDLLTEDEDREDVATGRHRFDIGLLSRRLAHAVDWLEQRPDTVDLPVGLFGASTGAAAALVAATERPARVSAVVSRGGRPDLAGDALALVSCPVLLIVGGDDTTVLDLNRRAAEQLSAAPHRIHVVPGATHLFPEPGALEQVADLAAAWFREHL